MRQSIPLLSLAILPTALSAQTFSERPNVILLVADDIGYADLSCYGAKGVETPTIDSIARAGIRFTDAHACAATSTPSRYALLTGQYPFRKAGTDVAAGNAATIIAPEQPTLADVFQKAGYRTAAIGKWHLGLGLETGKQDWNGTLNATPADLGFDYHYIMAATADRVPCVYIENGKVAHHDPTAPIEVSYRNNFEGEPTGKTHPELLTKLRSSHGHDQSIVNGIGRIGYMRGGGKALWQDESIADSIVIHAVDFIDRNSENPFFIYLCTNDVHVPRYPHPRFRGKSPMGLRGESILQLDWTVRQICDALRRNGLSENTLLIITSDNGPVLDDGYADQAETLVGEHRPGGPFRGGKYSNFEAGARVPFIVSWARHAASGKVSNALVSQIDALATFASLVGSPATVSAQAELTKSDSDSRNQLSTWLGTSEEDTPFAVKMASNHALSLRTGKWKYIEPSKGSKLVSWGPKIETGYAMEPQLYDLEADKGESKNLAKEHPETTVQMQQLLQQIRNRQ